MSCKLNNLEENSKEQDEHVRMYNGEELKTLVSLREAIFLPKFTSFTLIQSGAPAKQPLYASFLAD